MNEVQNEVRKVDIEDAPRILIWMDGGLIQEVSGNRRAIELGVEVIALDYDVEGTQEEISTDRDGEELLIQPHRVYETGSNGRFLMEKYLLRSNEPEVE
ncbi:hypothetical protein BAE30_11515 [Acidithiobacillus caldus]|uniref:Uncharacterized protein n=1 Tax=Acidithiobacillus caldus TaxID=33059 RepID=A0A1E7YTK1_9PROT|nr:hypothetical protein BAE30_11515 [Acidithiobacillus caldus]